MARSSFDVRIGRGLGHQVQMALPIASLGWAYLAYVFASRVLSLDEFVRHSLQIQSIPVCLFNLLTGIECPLCGLTRAFGQIMLGNFESATQLNSIALPVFVAWLLISVVCTIIVAMKVRTLRSRDFAT